MAQLNVFSEAVSPLSWFSKTKPGTEFCFFLDDAGVIIVMTMVLLGGLNFIKIPKIPFVSPDKNRIKFTVKSGSLLEHGKIAIASQVVELKNDSYEIKRHLGTLDYEMENGGKHGIRLAQQSLTTTGTVHLLHDQIERNLKDTSLLTHITNMSPYIGSRRVKEMFMEIDQTEAGNLLFVRMK